MGMPKDIASESDALLANLYLAAIIGAFIFLTLIAYLLTEGRSLCVIPIMKRCCPNSKWVVEHNKIEHENEERNLFNLDMVHHVFGVKKAQRQAIIPRRVILDENLRF